jgi:hypothetical protein
MATRTSPRALTHTTLARISDAAELPEGWFDSGSVGLSERAREVATEFVYLLAVEGLLARDARLDVIPIAGIQFEWAGNNGEIEVEIDAQGRFYLLVEHPDGSMEETPRSDPVSAIVVLPHIRHVLA